MLVVEPCPWGRIAPAAMSALCAVPSELRHGLMSLDDCREARAVRNASRGTLGWHVVTLVEAHGRRGSVYEGHID